MARTTCQSTDPTCQLRASFFMQNRTVTLSQEKWDKIIEFLDLSPINDPDKQIVLTDLHNQLEVSPADSPMSYELNSKHI